MRRRAVRKREDMSRNTGAPLPGGGQQRWWKIAAPKGSIPMSAVLLNSGYVGCWTHWDGRQLPCEMTPECALCRKGLPNRWGAYIASVVQEGSAWVEKVLALTEGAARQLLPQESHDDGLRGLVITLKRDGSKPNAPIKVKFHNRAELDKIPKGFDVWDSLMRMWGVNEYWHLHCRSNGGKRPEDWRSSSEMPRRRQAPDELNDIPA